jgi:gas vesicle protein
MGRFLLGFLIGAAAGAAVIVFTAPRSGSALRQSLSTTLQDTLDVAKLAQEARENQMWQEFRQQIAPPERLDEPLTNEDY